MQKNYSDPLSANREKRSPSVDPTIMSGITVSTSDRPEKTKKGKIRMNPFNQIFSDSLKTLMTDRSITGRDLAAALAVSEQLISQWRGGKVLPHWDNMVRLSQALKVPMAQLLGEQGYQPPTKPERPPFKFEDIAPCLDGAKGEQCLNCQMIDCRLVKHKTIACKDCIRRKDCMKCLRPDKPRRKYSFYLDQSTRAGKQRSVVSDQQHRS